MNTYKSNDNLRRYKLSGDKLKHYMDKANLSVLELSRLTGLSRTAIYNWKRRSVKVHQSTIELIAMHLGVTFDKLCDPGVDISNKDFNSVGQRLKLARLAQGLSIIDVAKCLDVSSSYISSCERETRELKFKFVRDYCRFLGISMDSLNLDFNSFNTDVIGKIISDR